MAKGAYVGVDGVAHKIKKIYTGVDNVARKVKKGYFGVGGVARPFFSDEGLEYYGVIDPLSVARSRLAATTVGDYALFGGGYTQSDGHYDTVDAYNSDLTRSTPTSLSLARAYLSSTTVGDYALFGGGLGLTRPQEKKTVDAYDRNLTKTSPNMELVAGRYHLAATTLGDYALFGGGYDGSPSDIIDIYDSYLVANRYINLSQRKYHLAATTVGNYALFGGGYTSYSALTDTVDAYDYTLTRSTPTSLSLARAYLSSTTVGDYALFGGGRGESYSYSDAVDAYDSTLTRSTPTSLSLARYHLAATTVGNYALFVGGIGNPSDIDKYTVDAYDNTLTRSTPTGLGLARSELAATTVGNYALFGGGYAKGYIGTVDAYYQEGASKTQACIVISSTTATGEYSFYLKDTADPENILAEIVVGEADTPEITLIAGHSYSFTGTSIAPTTPHEIIAINALTPESKQLSGFFGYSGLTLYVSPKFPKHDFINISINISGTDGDSDWG